jgi:hypothetical protein
MTVATFYLTCFVVGFALSLLSFIFSALHVHLPLKWHVPQPFGHHGAFPSAPGGAGLPVQHVGSRPMSAGGSWLNPSALLAFLAWFGGTGYLLTQYYRFWFLVGLGLATLSGLVGAAIVSLFWIKVLLRHEVILLDSDFDLVGTLARVNVPIRVGGTGEIIFSQQGVRSCSGARSANGKALEKGTEVVITRFDRGIAYVSRWEEWSK